LVKHQGDGHIDNKNRLTDLNKLNEIYKKNYIIQERVIQHEAYAKFHPNSLNSVRVNIYRSVKSEEIHVLNCFYKMGRWGQIVDNASTGGLWILANENGKLADFAISKEGKIWKHPDTGLSFKNLILPFIPQIRNTAIRAAQNFPSHRDLAFDVGIDINGAPKVLEVNLQRIGDPQYVSGPLFKSYTDEVKEYCLKNLKAANYSVIQF
jgi:hypothetical protein